MSEMNNMLAKEGCEMETEDNWQEHRRWMTDDGRASIHGRKREHRKIIIIYIYIVVYILFTLCFNALLKTTQLYPY